MCTLGIFRTSSLIWGEWLAYILTLGRWRCPLFQFSEGDVRSPVCQAAPDWGGSGIASAAKLLGFLVGPGNGDTVGLL